MRRIIFLFFLIVFIAGCTAVAPPKIAPKQCSVDADCVPAECCHAKDCLSKASGPDCSDTMCTQECVPGTIDCGGSCACVTNRCIAKNLFSS